MTLQCLKSGAGRIVLEKRQRSEEQSAREAAML
ncbi:hypothetical protein JOD82_004803 [Paenibacillus sp. 1182]|nr:hypothetical protein [Paenibacillus sp. 1182]